MNANVFLPADDETMAMKAWPKELRQKGALDECEFVPRRRPPPSGEA